MAWRVCLKRGQRWPLLLLSFLVLLLTISVMMMTTLPLPFPPSKAHRLPSRALSSAGGVRTRIREPPPPMAAVPDPLRHLLMPDVHSGSWRSTDSQEPSKHLTMAEIPPNPAMSADSLTGRGPTDSLDGRHRGNDATFKRKERPGTSLYPRYPHLLLITLNRTEPKHGIKVSSHSAAAEPPAGTHSHFRKSQSPPARAPTPVIKGRRPAGGQKDKHTSIRPNDSQRASRWPQRQVDKNVDRQANIRPKDSHNHANRQADSRHTAVRLVEHKKHMDKLKQAAKPSGKYDKVGLEQLAAKKLIDIKKHPDVPEDPSEKKKNNKSPLNYNEVLSKPKASVRIEEDVWCQSFREQDFPNSDQRRIRINPDLPLPWFSEDDMLKLELLAKGEVVSKTRVPGHGQVLQVGLDVSNQQDRQISMWLSKNHTAYQSPMQGGPKAHGEHCQQGTCSLVKRADDWFEVFAFHLDRVLGLNRSIPVVLRTFRSEILPYKYINGTPRPVVWWDPHIQHLADRDNDQNSVPLSWIQYQAVLQAHCGPQGADMNSAVCVGVHHSEWGRLALFDFLLQVNDRLDRNCCGFRPDPTEPCVENLLHVKCRNDKELLLVHILVRKADPSRLVFIDNAGRPHHPTDNLNFRLVEGIDEFPEKAVSVLQSGCLESLLLRSLYVDREFWESHGGARGLRSLIHTVEQRGKIILQYIRDKKLRLNRDL